jgi:hypothetical protein
MKFSRSVYFPLALTLLATPLIGVRAIGAGDDEPRREFVARLRGVNEVPLTLTAARGTLRLSVNADDSSVHFLLEYHGLQTPVLFSHIHIGQPNVNGGVTVFFCDNSAGSTRQPCPQGEGTVEGDFTADDVIGVTAQQLEVNNLDKVLSAIRAGETYANLHTMTSPGGEIRGQIRPARELD